MNKLDFLSGAPKTFIFARDSNKTNLGGIFTLIYLIVVFFIAYYSIYIYIKKQNYTVVYTYEEEYLNINGDEHKKKLNNDKLNQEITYKFEMVSNVNKSKYFATTYQNLNVSINFGEEQKTKVYDFGLYIWYNCSKLGNNSYDCSLRENINLPFYIFSLNYTGFKTEHQNVESPLQKNYISEYFFFTNDEKIINFYQKWKIIKYKDNNKEYYGGVIINDKMAIANMPDYYKNTYQKGRRLLCIIQIDYSWMNYFDDYTRSKKTIIEPISNISSLSMTFYGAFIFIYCSFFSNSFDNYIIIEKMLNKNERPILKNREKGKIDKTIKLSFDLGKK